ncbi:MAG: hypothetical protein M1829_000318 [Trizodia sp. TS-e1964]|nr:MAG: hypothetical protein M1829_000318 [Trizodia sp. TS-e1964]
MEHEEDLTRVCLVGGNAVSAFLSWRLQATNACDVTLVWKAGFDTVFQYGISFKSKVFENQRFKPRLVVRTPEEASGKAGAFDYVILCVKALPDVYDLASVIEPVVTPQHTCILVNTTHTLGVESHLEERFPTNVVLSLVCGAEITQLGVSEFEHQGSSEVWVGPANKNTSISASIQQDMADALAMTLGAGQVDCRVTENIRQQQYERMIGPIAFHPLSVLMETSSHMELMEKIGMSKLIDEIIDELLLIAKAQHCDFPDDFKQRTIQSMLRPAIAQSIMYQDFMTRRPMEIETYLGSPIKLAATVGVKLPRIETLYTLLQNINLSNQLRPPTSSPLPPNGHYPPRVSSAPPPPPRPMMNGNGPPMRGGRGPPMGGMPPPMRRGPPMNGYPPRAGPPNGYLGPPNGYPQHRGPLSSHQEQSQRGSIEGNELEEFSHLVLYENGEAVSPDGAYPDTPLSTRPSSSDLALRERELMLRQRELALREQELNMRRSSRRPPPPPSQAGGFDDDDDDDDYFDPSAIRGPPGPSIDPDNFDMMSVTSRRTRKAPNASQMRKNPEGGSSSRSSQAYGGGRPLFNKHRTSARLVADIPGLHESLMNNPMMGYSSNRYGNVDRKMIGDESRASSLTASRLEELQNPNGSMNGGNINGNVNGNVNGNGPQNGGYPNHIQARRASQSPGNPYSPGRLMGRQQPPQMNGNGGHYVPNGRPSPPNGVRQPVPRYPPGQGNQVAPHQVEQHAGVSNLYPPKGPPIVRSLTGSASASAESGDSGASANLDSENSAHSSRSSLGPRAPIGVR